MNFGKMRQDAMTVLTGDFVVRCIEAKPVKNSNGDDMIKTKLQIIAGPYTGRNLSNNFNIIPSNVPALQMFFSHMSHFGLDEAYFAKLPNGESGVHQIARDLVGRVVEVKVGSRKFQGVERENIEGIMPAPAGLGGVGQPQSTAQPLPTALPVASAQTVNGAASVTLPMTVGTPSDPDDAATDGSAEEPALPF
jgi:hypothetical protein